MRIPRSRSYETIRQVLRRRSVSYTITRPTQSSSARFGDATESTTTVSDVDMYLHQPEENVIDTEYGERVTGDLLGLALSGADIQHNDRVTYNGETYEIKQITDVPDEGTNIFQRFSLVRRTNDGTV